MSVRLYLWLLYDQKFILIIQKKKDNNVPNYSFFTLLHILRPSTYSNYPHPLPPNKGKKPSGPLNCFVLLSCWHWGFRVHNLQKREANIKVENKANCLFLSIALTLLLRSSRIISQKKMEEVKLGGKRWGWEEIERVIRALFNAYLLRGIRNQGKRGIWWQIPKQL